MRAGFRRLVELSTAWSVDEAVWILRVYRCAYDEICYRSYWTTPDKVGQEKEEDFPAIDTKVKFFGGPEGTTMYQGCLSMFVIDRVLAQWRQNDIDWAWLLQFNPDTVTHISRQLEEIRPYFSRQKLLPGFEDEQLLRGMDNVWNHIPDYEDGEQVVDYIEMGGEIYPILESGRQGCVVKRGGSEISIRAVKSSAESATVEIGACDET
jgi:hypothetical protein